MTRGGKREGAGRKASPEGNRVLMSARVLPSTLAALKQMAAESGTSVGTIIDNLTERI
jgi:hypothetical protein